MLKAYKRWQSANRLADYDCGCTLHLIAIYGYEKNCDRHKAWVLYVKARDGEKLTQDELFYIGCN